MSKHGQRKKILETKAKKRGLHELPETVEKTLDYLLELPMISIKKMKKDLWYSVDL